MQTILRSFSFKVTGNNNRLTLYLSLQLEPGDGYTTLPPTQAPINPPYKTAKALKQKDLLEKCSELQADGAVAMVSEENDSITEDQVDTDEVNPTDNSQGENERHVD